jgi:membrane peptidoglycan carboxypeptidase
MSFRPGVNGIEEAAKKFIGKRPDQMDGEEVARVMVLARDPAVWRDRDKWRLRRDHLLQELQQHGFMDDATLHEGIARSMQPEVEREASQR